MYQLSNMHGKNIKIDHVIFCCRFSICCYRRHRCHSGGAPVLDPQVLQSQVTAQDYTGSTLLHSGNGKYQQGNSFQRILTQQYFGMWLRVIWYISTNASYRNMLSPIPNIFPPWKRRQQRLSKQWHNLPMYSASRPSPWGDTFKCDDITLWRLTTLIGVVPHR